MLALCLCLAVLSLGRANLYPKHTGCKRVVDKQSRSSYAAGAKAHIYCHSHSDGRTQSPVLQKVRGRLLESPCLLLAEGWVLRIKVSY